VVVMLGGGAFVMWLMSSEPYSAHLVLNKNFWRLYWYIRTFRSTFSSSWHHIETYIRLGNTTIVQHYSFIYPISFLELLVWQEALNTGLSLRKNGLVGWLVWGVRVGRFFILLHISFHEY
jgi:hypothetical protein